MKLSIAGCVQIVLFSSFVTLVVADDWPTWRRDARRSAATSEELATNLHLQWWRQYPLQKPAWPEDVRLYFDASYEPIVMGRKVFLSSSRSDSVTALDVDNGKEVWRFFAAGPIRFAPIASEGRIYFGADDGFFYCLDVAQGRLVWKRQVAPTRRRVLGNERLISLWPVRGGPVLDGETIYFTAGVWPFEGTFLYALNKETGEPVSVMGGQGVDASLLDLTVTTLKDKTPQGYLAMNESKLLIPCGRSVAVCLDRMSGDFVNFSYSTSSTTNYHVCTSGTWLFHGTISFDMAAKQTAPVSTWRPVLTDEVMYFAQAGNVVAYDLTKRVNSKDRRGELVEKAELERLWSHAVEVIEDVSREGPEYEEWIKSNPLRIHIKAGNRLYGHQQNTIFAVDLPESDLQTPSVAWKQLIDGTVSSMIAANGNLYVVTREGGIYCFGPKKVAPLTHPWRPLENELVVDGWEDRASSLLEQTDMRDGYCLFLGVGSGRLVEELARQSNLRIIAVDSDKKTIDTLRRHFDALGFYGSRISLHVGDPMEFDLPPYMANLVIARDWEQDEDRQGEFVKKVFEVLRPYGGIALFASADDGRKEVLQRLAASDLSNAKLDELSEFIVLRRIGALNGSADWTHEYGDPSNTLMSLDDRVKAPLGVLWFGGPSSDTELFYNRHFWGPSMAVVDGRMFLQGPGKLTAVDVYTGRVVWKIPLDHDENYNPGRRGNDFEGVLAGFHFLVMTDGVYIVLGNEILRRDPRTGNLLARFKAPQGAGKWGRIRVEGDLLIASLFRTVEKYGELPVELVAMNRYDGQIRWTKQAKLSFPVVAIGSDKVFCFDGALENLYRDAARKGLVPKAADARSLHALDLETGEELWQSSSEMVVTWLSYGESRDVLIATNKKGIAAIRGNDGENLWTKQSDGVGFKGHPETLWDKVVIMNDRLVDQRGPGLAYDLETGQAITSRNPITGQKLNWQFTREGHHCNYAIANPHLLTFRSDCAGICDITTGQTARLQGFRTGCRNSLIPANGVLNAPNFAHGCVCGYSIFTSLALVHLPQTEMWNYSALTMKDESVERVGINFGAPGDRLSKAGVLWLDYPNVGGTSPNVPVKLNVDKARWFQLHSAFVQGDGPAWVSASGLEGAGSLEVGVLNSTDVESVDRRYTIRLHFIEPTAVSAAQRSFDVQLEGKDVLVDFDIFRESGGRNRSIVKEFEHVQVGQELEIALKSRIGRPLIAGVEIVVE